MHTEDPAIDDGYKKLLTAVLLVAWKDAHGRNAEARAAALVWLNGPGAENLCDWLGRDVCRLRKRLTTPTQHLKRMDNGTNHTETTNH